MKTLYRRTYLMLALATLVAGAWLVDGGPWRPALAMLAGALALALVHSRAAAVDGLRRSLDIERTHSQILQLLLRSERDEFEVNLERALRRAAVFAGAGAAFLYRLDGEEGVRAEAWAGAPGGLAQAPDDLGEVLVEASSRTRGEVAMEARHGDMPLLLVPVGEDGAPWGMVGLFGHAEGRAWTAHESRLVQSVAGVLAAAHSRHLGEIAMRAALEEARASNEAKSRFLANMSHEIRTPLNCIVGLSEHLGDLEPNREQRQSLELIRHSSDVLLQIISDILDLSRIEAGGIAITDEDFDLPRLLENTVGMFATRADDKGLSLDLDLPEGLPRKVRGDESRLGQILTNLLGNAVKFTQEGGICLSVAVDDAPAAGGSPVFRFDVTDSGIGIAPDKLEQVFDCFTQADASTTRLYGGTGLGLAISRSLAELMDGRLSAASVLDRGSVFTVEVPLAMAIDTADGAMTAERCAEPPTSFGGYRVLVVEDDALNQMVARKMLVSLGCEVEVAEDGKVALDLVTWQDFDLILMDYQMPGLDGPATTRALRTLGGWCAEVPVVALTANALDIHQRICLDAGMDGFLTKPIRKRELAATLATLPAPVSLA